MRRTQPNATLLENDPPNTVTLDFNHLETLRTNHPAWRLPCSPHASLVASVLSRAFVAQNVRVMHSADLAELLSDTLYAMREQSDQALFPKSAVEYLNDWASPDKGWLRKFY